MTTETRTAPVNSGRVVANYAYAAAALFFIFNAATLGAKSLWVDEMRTGYAALTHSPHELFRYIALNDPVSPLYTLLSVAVCKFFGVSEWALRLPALLFGAASIIVFAPLAGRLLKREAAFIAVILLALSPNLIGYSQEARAYTAFLFVSLIAFRLAVEFNETRGAALKLAAVFVLGMYIHAFFAFVILDCVLYVFVFNGDKGARAKTLACVVVAVVAFVPWLLAVSRLNTGAPERLPGPELSAPMKVAFVFGGLLVGNAYVAMRVVSIASMTGVALWLYGIFRMLNFSRRQAQVVLLWTVAPIAAMIAAFALFSKFYDMFHFRYAIFALPMVLIPIAAAAGFFMSENIAGVVGGEGSFADRFKRAWFKPLGAANFAGAALLICFLCATGANVKAYYKAQNQDWRGALKYIDENIEPGDSVVLHSIADSSVRFYARISEKKYSFTGTNRISDTVNNFALAPRKFFVYYRPRYGKNIFARTQNAMDSLVKEESVFPGLYGDVVVGRSEGYTLANEFSLFLFDKLPAGKTKYEIAHPVLMKESEREFIRRRYSFFNIAKGVFKVFPLEIYAGIEREKRKDGHILRIVNGEREYSAKWSRPIFVTLDRGAVDVDVMSPVAGFSLQRRAPIKFVDEGTGPEFRGYFLDWIRK